MGRQRAFFLQKTYFGLNPAISGVTAHLSVGTEHAVTRNGGCKGIGAKRAADRAGSIGLADFFGDPAVGSSFAARDSGTGGPDFSIKFRVGLPFLLDPGRDFGSGVHDNFKSPRVNFERRLR